MPARIPQESDVYVVLSYNVDTQESDYAIYGGPHAYKRAVAVAGKILTGGPAWTASVYEIPYVPVYGTHKKQHEDAANARRALTYRGQTVSPCD